MMGLGHFEIAFMGQTVETFDGDESAENLIEALQGYDENASLKWFPDVPHEPETRAKKKRKKI